MCFWDYIFWIWITVNGSNVFRIEWGRKDQTERIVTVGRECAEKRIKIGTVFVGGLIVNNARIASLPQYF